MTYEEIYDKIVLYVWGNTAPPSQMANLMRGSEGLIATARKQLEKEFNFFYMLSDDTNDLTDSTADYTLDADSTPLCPNLKEIQQVSLYDSDTGVYKPLTRLSTGQWETIKSENDITEEATWPSYYILIDGGNDDQQKTLTLYPTPSTTKTNAINISYYKFTDALSDTIDTWNSTEDSASVYIPMLIVWNVVKEISIIRRDVAMIQIAEKQIQTEARAVFNYDWELKTGDINKIPYTSL